MGTTINNAIYSVAAFYHTDGTKGRAKELVNELSSTERKLLISILNKTFDPTTDCQALTDKLIAIHEKDARDAFTPIAHEKDKDRSYCDKSWINVWRTIKDCFGARISDRKLIMGINTFSEQAALQQMDAIKTDSDLALQNQDPYDFFEDITDLDRTNNYYLDLSPIFLKGSSDGFIHKFVEELSDGIQDDVLKQNYSVYLLATRVRNELLPEGSGLFAPKTDFTMKNLLERINDTGFVNLSLRQQNLVRYFIQEYKASLT